jgi:HAD superfamily hydrolase (TIGR01509 family)
VIRAILYDFDGTLVNSLAIVVAATNAVLAAHQAPARPKAEIIAGMLYPTGQRIGGLLGITDPDGQKRLTAEFGAAAHRVSAGNAFAYDGIASALAGFATAGFPQGVVSNNDGRLVRRLLADLGLAAHIAVAFGEEDMPAPKPDPRGLLLATERLGAAVDECIYIGDTSVDQRTASAVGMRCIGVAWGITPRSVLERAGFTALVDTPMELDEVIRRLS